MEKVVDYLKKKTLGPHFQNLVSARQFQQASPMRKNGGKKAYSALLCSVGFDDVITLAMNTVALAMNTVPCNLIIRGGTKDKFLIIRGGTKDKFLIIRGGTKDKSCGSRD